MASPPIVIGPFSNVPAPGSPIRSDWPQQMTRFVAGLQWGNSAANSDGNACIWVIMPRAYVNNSYMIMLTVLGGGTATTSVARHLSVVQGNTLTDRFLVRYFDASGAAIASTFAPFHWMTWGTLP